MRTPTKNKTNPRACFRSAKIGVVGATTSPFTVVFWSTHSHKVSQCDEFSIPKFLNLWVPHDNYRCALWFVRFVIVVVAAIAPNQWENCRLSMFLLHFLYKDNLCKGNFSQFPNSWRDTATTPSQKRKKAFDHGTFRHSCTTLVSENSIPQDQVTATISESCTPINFDNCRWK